MRGKNDAVRSRAEAYQVSHGPFTISAVTVLEVVKGFQKAERPLELQRFVKTLSALRVLPFSEAEAVVAGKIYGDLERRGTPIGRADPMIAATAIVHDLVLATGNETHYQHIRDAGYVLPIDNWRRSDRAG